MNKMKKLCLCLLLCIVSMAGLTTSSATRNSSDSYDKVVDTILTDLDDTLNEYIDVSYFTGLKSSSNTKAISTLSKRTANEEKLDIKKIKYEAITSAVTQAFSELNQEEYDTLTLIGEEDEDIALMLDLIENGFEEYDEYYSESNIKSSSNIVSSNELTTLLGNCGFTIGDITVINGVYRSLLKLFASPIPTALKAAIAGTLIAVVGIYIIVHWDDIQPYFDDFVDSFVRSAKKLKKTIRNIFDKIAQVAIAALGIYSTFEDVIDNTDDLSSRARNENIDTRKVTEVLAKFLGISAIGKFYDSNNKVLCIGRDMKETYDKFNDISGYQNYAKINKFWSFWVSDYEKEVGRFGSKLIEFANDTLIYYCCLNNWDFVLVTDPYYYMAEHLDFTYGGFAYASEIKIIRDHNYNRFLNNSSLKWKYLPKPVSNSRDSFFAYRGYRVSR